MTPTNRDVAEHTSIFLDLAGIGICLLFDRPLTEVSLDPAYARFSGSRTPEVSINCSFSETPLTVPKNANLVFDSQGLWSLYDHDGDQVFALEAPYLDDGPFRIARFDDSFSRGEITSRPVGKSGICGPLLPDPLEYPLGEAITVNLACRRRGMMIHACGLSLDGEGILLAGHSGAGKSTIARLVGEEAIVLNDDRVIVRIEDGKPRMYGTPWHGDHPGVDPMGIDLAKILFIEHAAAGRVEPRSGVSAAAMLIARSFPPAWSLDKMNRCLDTASEIIEATPCFSLGFTPDESVLDLIRRATRRT